MSSETRKSKSVTTDDVFVPDVEGNTVKLVNLDGGLYARPTSRAILNDVFKMKVRDDDIWLVTYPKSGTHWTWEIISMVLNQRAEYVQHKLTGQVEFTEKLQDFDKMESPRVLNTHLPPHRVPPALLTGGCKVIFVYRNPKDVAISLYDHLRAMRRFHYSGTPQGFIPAFIHGKLTLHGPWLDYMKAWQSKVFHRPHKYLVLSYEDMKENLGLSVAKIAAFLNKPMSEGLKQAIVEKCTFATMVKPKREQFGEIMGKIGYNKGEVGRWRQHFSVADSEAMDVQFKKEMANFPWPIKFSLTKSKL